MKYQRYIAIFLVLAIVAAAGCAPKKDSSGKKNETPYVQGENGGTPETIRGQGTVTFEAPETTVYKAAFGDDPPEYASDTIKSVIAVYLDESGAAPAAADKAAVRRIVKQYINKVPDGAFDSDAAAKAVGGALAE